MYQVVYSKAAQKVFRKLQPKLQKRIEEKVAMVAQDPYGNHNEVSRLQGRHDYRLRIGDWRVIYRLEDERLILVAFDIQPRGGAYKH